MLINWPSNVGVSENANGHLINGNNVQLYFREPPQENQRKLPFVAGIIPVDCLVHHCYIFPIFADYTSMCCW